jgi:phosphoenolpyruvate synthase/pyruvate phosphate dikinase
MSDILIEAGILQDRYDKLVRDRKLTKKAMCDLCVPFRDKYGLTDMQTLQIARRELSISQIYGLNPKEGAVKDE